MTFNVSNNEFSSFYSERMQCLKEKWVRELRKLTESIRNVRKAFQNDVEMYILELTSQSSVNILQSYVHQS